ncbi:hypothetical protein GmHk_14G040071 [Glycine max]|nr:hypothetical protein GmHk_14G040071 [Glycine max]
MNLLLQNASQPTRSPSNNGSPLVPPIYASLPVKEILLGFPHFNGTTPVMEWIFKAKKFFTYHNTPDASRVDIVAMHFDKDMSQTLSLVSTWSELTRALESQFQPSPFDCPMVELFKLQQIGLVSDYYLKFMSLTNRSLGLCNEAFLNCFISGLNPDIRRDVVAMCPPTLLHAVSLAKLFEENMVLFLSHFEILILTNISKFLLPMLNQNTNQIQFTSTFIHSTRSSTSTLECEEDCSC